MTIAHAQERFSEDLFSDSSEQKLFPTDNSTLDTTHTGEGNVVAEDQNDTAGTSTLEVDVTQNEDQTEENAVAEDQTEEDTQQDTVTEDQTEEDT